MRTGNHKTAIVDFDRVIAIDPDYARAYHLRGLAREIEGDDKGALDDFNRAIALKPDYGAAYHSRATLHTKMGQMDDAAEDIRMVTHLTQQNIETFANENNVWRSNHMHLESILETEMNR
jgi:Tfp pilus assembly protein PilF